MILTILIPVYNEQDTIASIIDTASHVDLPIDREFVVVDDGSTDRTQNILKQLAKEHPDTLKVVFQDKNRGKGAAIKRGIQSASGDIIIIQDADLEYNPNEYTRLLQPILSGKADVVYGSRFSGGEPHRVLYFWHYIGNKFLTMLSNMFTNLNLTDMECGYKVFKKDVLVQLELRENRFGFEPEVTAKVAKIKCPIYEVGISYSGRTYQEGKKIKWQDGLGAIWYIVRYGLFK